MDWFLGNGEEIQAANSRFKFPGKRRRRSLQPGDFAKLIFLTEDDEIGGEKLWVQVIKKEHGNYIGELDIPPMLIPELKKGDMVTFRSENIIDILPVT